MSSISSVFNKTSTRMFCITGELSDIFCRPDGVIMNFEEFLVYRLHDLGYNSVVFCSTQRNLLYAFDPSGCRGIDIFLKKKTALKPEPEPEKSVNTEKAKQQYSALLDYDDDDDDDDDDDSFDLKTEKQQPVEEKPVKHESDEKLEYSHVIKKDVLAVSADRFMKYENEKNVLVFTSLEDLIKLGDTEDGRKLLECFENWKGLPNENRNICIFLSKTLGSSGLQNLLQENHTSVLESLFISGGEFNSNACVNIGSPLNDEISSLLEHLRINGVTYTAPDGKVKKSYLRFHYSEKTDLVRMISFCNRGSGYTQLKIIREIIENYMADCGTEIVWLTCNDIKKCYPDASENSVSVSDPLEILKNREGWEPAFHVLNSFVKNYKRLYPDCGNNSDDLKEYEPHMNVDRFEGSVSGGKSNGKVPNFVLQGPPGVGKTEIANLIGKILQREGILKSGHTVIGSRDRLIGEYVGSTAIKTASVIEEAQEGVLLVDEVYSLAENNGEHNVSYCNEAFDTIVAAMTNKNYRFCVIFAGYATEMHKVWKMNEGLLSRFSASNVITLEEYKPPLLQKIFESQFGKPEGISGQTTVLSDDVKSGLPVFFENYFSDRDRKNFGNARDVNNLVAEVKRSASYRHVLEMENNSDESPSADIVVTRDDFENRKSLFDKRGYAAEDIYSKVYEYEGLEFIADMFNDQLALRVECMEKNLPYPGPSHMIWAGNPGTGKSTAAQLTTDLYHTLGILGGTEPVYVDASEIISQYHGGAAQNIRQKMDEACQKNTVLVIEEAYQLITSGKEAINAMLNRMETDRSKFTLILILYKDTINSFLKENAGLASRFKIYEFPDYNAEQLYSIFGRMCKKTRDSFTDECGEKVKDYLGKLYASGESKKGNARLVRQLHEEMKQNRYKRITEELAVSVYGENTQENRNRVSAGRAMGTVKVPDNAYTFTGADVPEYIPKNRGDNYGVLEDE